LKVVWKTSTIFLGSECLKDLPSRMDNARKFDLENRLVEFTIKITDVVESLPDSKVANYLGGQLLRSGSSPVLNYGEAQAAESRRDFIHKLRIILKELRETSICLTLLNRKSYITDSSLLKESKELIAIFAKSIGTAQANNPTKD
jgi:four helix bundle protein